MADEFESAAEWYVSVSADRHSVVLDAPGAEPVTVGPFPNPAVAREKADALRQFVAALLAGPRFSVRPLRDATD